MSNPPPYPTGPSGDPDRSGDQSPRPEGPDHSLPQYPGDQPAYGTSDQPAYGQQSYPQQGNPQGQYGSYPPPPPPEYDGRLHKRPGTVLAGAIMCWVGAAFGVLIGLVLAAASGDEQFRNDLDISTDAANTLRLLGIGLALWSLLVVVFAVLAFLGRYWALIVLAVMAAIYTVLSLVGLATGGGGSGIFGVIYTWVAVALLFAGSKAWYASR